MAEVAKSSQAILRHDMGNVDMESQVSEMVRSDAEQFGAHDHDRSVPSVADCDSWNGLGMRRSTGNREVTMKHRT